MARPKFESLILVASTAILLATLGGSRWPSAARDDLPAFGPLQALVHWDAGWYGAIAKDGYFYRPGEQSPVAYFPLYPLAISGVMALGVNRWVAGVCLSLVFGLCGILLFSRWARHVSPSHAATAGWLLILYPFSIYLYGVVYSDGLFLLCAVAAFVALEHEHPLAAGLLGALATACRPVGPAVVVGLLARSVERRRQRGLAVRWVDLLPGLAVLGLLGWMTYLGWRFGDPLAFIHVQSAPGWSQPPGWQSWLKVEWFRIMSGASPLVAFRLGGHALATFVALALVVPTWKRLGFGYGLYVLIAVGIPAASSKDFHGLGRYVIAAFPLFLTGATLVDEAPLARRAVLAAFASLLAFCAVAFGAGGYVA